GETEEVIRLLESIRRIGAPLIAINGDPRSTLARAAHISLNCGIDGEACPLNRAPTASTTAALALGDALAMAVLVKKGFREEDFAALHPGGRFGRRLCAVGQGGAAGQLAPIVTPSTQMPDVFHEMSSKRLGMTCVVDQDGRLAGVFTDGDLRRLLTKTTDVLTLTAGQVRRRDP